MPAFRKILILVGVLSSLPAMAADDTRFNPFTGKLDYIRSSSGDATFNALKISNLDCSGYGNGGALTTDGSGNVVCSDDDGGAGGSGDITQVGTTLSGAAATATSNTEATFSRLHAVSIGFTGVGDATFSDLKANNQITGKIGGTTASDATFTTAIANTKFIAPDGSTSVTGYGFASNPQTGFAFDGTNILSLFNGVHRHSIAPGSLQSADADGYRIQRTAGTESVPTYGFNSDANTGMFSNVSDTLQFTTGGTERVRIDTTGQVGIGSLSPTHKLHVDGSITAGAATFLTINSTRIGNTSAADATFTAVTPTNLSASQCVQTDSNGKLVSSGGSCGGGGTPGGSNTQLQYNNSGSFGGITNATTDGTNVTLAGGTINNMRIGNTSAADATFATIRATKIDATPIGRTSAADATFTNVEISLTGSLNARIGTQTAHAATFTNLQAQRIGNVTAGEATFTAIQFTRMGNITSGDATFATIRATKIDATAIGRSSAADATFTAVTPTNLTASRCVETDANGKLVSAGAACGSGGGEWTDTGTTLHPSDLSGAENVIIGTTSIATAPAVITSVGQATFADISGKIGRFTASDATFSVAIMNGGGTNVLNTVDIDGGTIDGTKIGASSSADATFATINSSRIGNASAADATFTSISITNGVISAGDATFTALRAVTSVATPTFFNLNTGEAGITKTCNSNIVVKGGIVVSCS